MLNQIISIIVMIFLIYWMISYICFKKIFEIYDFNHRFEKTSLINNIINEIGDLDASLMAGYHCIRHAIFLYRNRDLLDMLKEK